LARKRRMQGYNVLYQWAGCFWFTDRTIMPIKKASPSVCGHKEEYRQLATNEKFGLSFDSVLREIIPD